MRRGRIDHALFMLVRCDSGRKVYPARGLRRCRATDSAGTRRPRAPASSWTCRRPQIDALRVPDWKKTILRAMAEYGLYVGRHHGRHALEHLVRVGRHLHELRAPRTRWSASPARPASAARRTARTTSTGRAASTGAATCAWWTPAWPSAAAEPPEGPLPGQWACAPASDHRSRRSLARPVTDSRRRRCSTATSRGADAPFEGDGCLLLKQETACAIARARRNGKPTALGVPRSSDSAPAAHQHDDRGGQGEQRRERHEARKERVIPVGERVATRGSGHRRRHRHRHREPTGGSGRDVGPRRSASCPS